MCGEASNVQAMLFHSALARAVSFEGNPPSGLISGSLGQFLLLQGYKLWSNCRSKSDSNCILQIRPDTGITRGIWIAEILAELEKMQIAADTTTPTLLPHQLHPTSTA